MIKALGKMKELLYTITILFARIRLYAGNADKSLNMLKEEDTVSKTDTMRLKITVGDKTATAVLYGNPTSRDFAAMLPLTVKMDDYSNTEKIFYPSRKLSAEDAPAGFDPSVGDITLYAPWGNIALFYKDFGYSNGLISLGKVTSGMEAFMIKGSVTVKFELGK
jgi:hypothetical protein